MLLDYICMRELWKLEILEREANKIEISFAELSNLLFCGGGSCHCSVYA
jgi:hypothetical protein